MFSHECVRKAVYTKSRTRPSMRSVYEKKGWNFVYLRRLEIRTFTQNFGHPSFAKIFHTSAIPFQTGNIVASLSHQEKALHNEKGPEGPFQIQGALTCHPQGLNPCCAQCRPRRPNSRTWQSDGRHLVVWSQPRCQPRRKWFVAPTQAKCLQSRVL